MEQASNRLAGRLAPTGVSVYWHELSSPSGGRVRCGLAMTPVRSRSGEGEVLRAHEAVLVHDAR